MKPIYTVKTAIITCPIKNPIPVSNGSKRSDTKGQIAQLKHPKIKPMTNIVLLFISCSITSEITSL